LPERTEENHKTLQSGYPVSEPRFETVISQIRSRSVKHSTKGFGKIMKITMIMIIHFNLIPILVCFPEANSKQVNTNNIIH
jgi:hypothetical protein